MKISMNLPDEHQFSVMQRVLDGSLAVDSIEEFHEILKIYPDDALLHRKYADLLLEKHRLTDAVQAFDKAARLFIEQGMNLQAMVAKIRQWEIEKPTHEQGLQFQRLLSTKGSKYSPLQRLWANMRYPELITTMLRLVRIRLSAGEQITCVDDPANEIYFVVSGTLTETLSEDCRTEAYRSGVEIEPRFIGPNDIFGNIFPLDETTVNTTDVSAVTDVELVKIAKPVLLEACRKHPRIEDLLRGIYKPGNEDGCDRPWQTVRRFVRFGVPTQVEIISPEAMSQESTPPPPVWTGMAVDISSGGMCVDLGATASPEKQISLKGRTLQSMMKLGDNEVVLTLTGKIVWQRMQKTGKGANLLIGVRFASLNAADRKLLIDYCTGK
jgi:hypothetical protein